MFSPKSIESHIYKENGIFASVANFHYAFIYLFFMKEVFLYRTRFPLKLYGFLLYQFCFPLEHHLADKVPSILFSCQILISFLGDSQAPFISPQFSAVLLICGLPEVSWGEGLALPPGVSALAQRNLSRSRHNMCTNSQTLVASCQLSSRKPCEWWKGEDGAECVHDSMYESVIETTTSIM